MEPPELNGATSVTHNFRSKLPDLPAIPNHVPLHNYCFEKLLHVADHPCLIVGSTGKIFSYSETHMMCRRTATRLSKLGIKKGDLIMILLHNCVEFVFFLMGASMIGAVSTTANPRNTATEILHQARSSNTKIIITHSQYINKLDRCSNAADVDGIPKLGHDFMILVTDDDTQLENCLSDQRDSIESVALSFLSTDPVVVPYTSGTTGDQKGVVLTHKSLITGVAQQVDGENPNRFMSEEDVVLCVLPLFHIFALSSVMLCGLRAGSGILLVEEYKIDSMLEMIQRHRVSVAVLVPPLVIALTREPIVEDYDLTSVRVVLSGAGKLGKELEVALRNRLPLAVLGQGYGITEAGPVITMCLGFAKEPFSTKHLSCGTVVRNAAMKIVDLETGLSLGYNQSGEICIRGDQIMKGYLNNDAATVAAIDADCWLHTGDIGYVDDNDEVFIVDRVKDVIKYKGFQVRPTELEAVLVSHPSIADAAIVSKKDESGGEVPVAFVVRSINGSGGAAAELINEDAVREFLVKQVGYFYKIVQVAFVHAIPKSPFGKIMRKDLRAQLASNFPISQTN